MPRFALTLAAMLISLPAAAQINAGTMPASPAPFTTTAVATFRFPWRIAFLPDGRMLVTEKPGALWLVTQQGRKAKVGGVPAVEYKGQGGLLGVFVSPHHATDHAIYLTYAEPGAGGSSLAVARAVLTPSPDGARLDRLKVIWRELPKGQGGQFGAIIAFAPDGNSLFLTVGDRQRFTPAQDRDSALGKILHLTLDGAPAPGNPMAGQRGAQDVSITTPPKDTEAAQSAIGRKVSLPGPNLAPAETWASGFRTPYGLAFDDRGRLWEVEHGPRGGDELNLIRRGGNYGWPLVSYGINYDGVPIADPAARPDLIRPAVYWTPVIAPGGFAFYRGALFPAWRGSALVTGLNPGTLVRIGFDAGDGAKPIERWSFDGRIRDVAIGPDGAIWLIEDSNTGRLLKLTPKQGIR